MITSTTHSEGVATPTTNTVLITWVMARAHLGLRLSLMMTHILILSPMSQLMEMGKAARRSTMLGTKLAATIQYDWAQRAVAVAGVLM